MKTITIKRAAELLNMNPFKLAKFLQMGKLPEIGVAIKAKKYYSYLIFEEDVKKFIERKNNGCQKIL